MPTPIANSDSRSAPVQRARWVRYAPGAAFGVHAHPLDCVSLVVAGRIEERVGRREVIGAAHSVVVKPAGVEHANRVARTGATTVQVYLTDEERRSWSEWAVGLDQWRWFEDDAAALALLRLLAVDEGRPTSWTRNEALVELASTLGGPLRAQTAAPRWLVQVREELGHGGRTVQDLAQEAGVHPITLARRFRAAFGIAPTEHRRRARAQRALRALLGGRGAPGEVAFACGFADQAHLTRELGALTGWTPRQLRDLASAADRASLLHSFKTAGPSSPTL